MRSTPKPSLPDQHPWRWFTGLYAAGLLAVGAVSGALHWFIKLVI